MWQADSQYVVELTVIPADYWEDLLKISADILVWYHTTPKREKLSNSFGWSEKSLSTQAFILMMNKAEIFK